MYNVFSNKSFKIKKFSIRNLLFLFMLVLSLMGFHAWIVYKTLAVLDDVSSIIILKRGELITKHFPTKTIYVHRDRNFQEHGIDCCVTKNCILLDKCHPRSDKDGKIDVVMYDKTSLKSEKRPLKDLKKLNIFTSETPPQKEDMCDIYYDDFFHLTYTYRLDSDVVSKYFVVRDLTGNIIAPGLAPIWNANLSSVDHRIKSKIKQKTKAVAYLSYNCELETDLNKLQETFLKYALKIDTFNCSNVCENGICDVASPGEYYFYVIFEEYFAEDYVTDKILHAYDNYVVPIVFGGANYSRFLPPHSYIDAHLLKLNDVAAKIRDSINNVTQYEEYFKWRNLYTIERYQPLCDLCAALNKTPLNPQPKKDFRQWWYGKEIMRTHNQLSPQIQNETVNSNTTEVSTSINAR